MKRRRLFDILWQSSLLVGGAVGCDHTYESTTVASRAEHTEVIDRCLADPDDCESLCWSVFDELYETGELVTVDDCVIESLTETSATVFVRYTETVECMGGRRPRGFATPARTGSGVGAWLARIATVEAASVLAFARLVHALEQLAAPRALIAGARRAIADEVRHARTVGALARRFGARAERPAIAPVPVPGVFELARENAIEGQVAETFGALVATCQARTASDPAVRTVFARIAHDESAHAALAHQLAPWLDRHLTRGERAEIAELRRDASAALGGEIDLGLESGADRALLGVPDPRRLARAADATFAALHT